MGIVKKAWVMENSRSETAKTLNTLIQSHYLSCQTTSLGLQEHSFLLVAF